MPFLPLYFQQLGVDDVGEIAMWSGLSLGVTPALTAMLAPFWGRLADRYGRKIMVERSLISFVVVMGAMAFVHRPWHVFGLRALQGFFAGYGSLTLTMAADSAPRDRMAYAIGFVQTAQRLGPAIGPIVGGVVAQVVGLRNAFLVTACFYLVAVLLVVFMYDEHHAHHATAHGAEGRVTFRNMLAFENFILLMAVVFGLQFIDRSFGPILPLFVAELGTPVNRVPIVAGVLFSIAAGTGAIGHHFCGRLLRRASARRVIAMSAAVGAAGAFIYVLARSPWVLVAWHADFRHRDRRRDDGGLHRREQRDAGDGTGRRIRPADDGVAGRSRAEPDRERHSGCDEHPRRVRPRHGRAWDARRAGVAPHDWCARSSARQPPRRRRCDPLTVNWIVLSIRRQPSRCVDSSWTRTVRRPKTSHRPSQPCEPALWSRFPPTHCTASPSIRGATLASSDCLR